MTTMMTLAILLSTVGSATAREGRVAEHGNVSAAPAQGQGPTDPAELETFLDQLIGEEMEEYHVAGAAVSVVKDGALLFARGYGYADLENRIPVDPARTVFLIGSVTKLFTWTAVMQLVEQGRLDLEKDVNTYLDFHIPDTYLQPITLRHLLTHTAGFEELLYDVLTFKEEDLVPPGEWMASHIPGRVRPPGEYAAYSNYGTALAGYIVARVSGQPYEQYIQENILNPLGMANTSASMPMPPELRSLATRGYTYNDDHFQVFSDYLGQVAFVPAGGMVSSATDMARFMIAHLQGGFYGDASSEIRILDETTMRQMHSTLFTHDPRLMGTAYGFFDFSDNGQRTIGHSGEADPINTLMLLMPDQNLGIFVAYNSDGGGDLTLQHLGFQRAFFDHYYPAPAIDPIQPPADFASRADRFVGSYRLTRTSYTTLEKVINLMGASVEIRNPGDGTLVMATPWGEWRFIEVEPLFFRQVDAPFHIVFREDDQGRITHLFTDYTPMYSFEKLYWYEKPGFHMALLLGCVLLFLSMLPVAVIRAIRNRRLRSQPKPSPRVARLAEWILSGICVLNLLFVAGTVLWGNPRPLFGISTIYQVVLGLGVLSALLTIGALVSMVLAWKYSNWGGIFRTYYSFVTVASVAFIWFLNFWNLLGWRY